MVAARLDTMQHGGDRRSEQDANLHAGRADAAEMLNLSTRTVAHAAVVRDRAQPELQGAVDQGKIAVSVVAKAATLPAKHQERPRGVSYAPNSGYIAASRQVKSWANKRLLHRSNGTLIR
jgi:hypothetical protein